MLVRVIQAQGAFPRLEAYSMNKSRDGTFFFCGKQPSENNSNISIGCIEVYKRVYTKQRVLQNRRRQYVTSHAEGFHYTLLDQKFIALYCWYKKMKIESISNSNTIFSASTKIEPNVIFSLFVIVLKGHKSGLFQQKETNFEFFGRF